MKISRKNMKTFHEKIYLFPLKYMSSSFTIKVGLSTIFINK